MEESIKSTNVEFNKEAYEKYEVLVSDFRKDSILAMLSNFLILVRRLSLLYMAMFILDKSWLNILFFMAQTLFFLVFVILVRPYKEDFNNNLNIFNESCSLIICYFILQMNGNSYTPEMQVAVGTILVQAIYTSWLCNGIIIGKAMFGELRRTCRKKCYDRKLKKLAAAKR